MLSRIGKNVMANSASKMEMLLSSVSTQKAVARLARAARGRNEWSQRVFELLPSQQNHYPHVVIDTVRRAFTVEHSPIAYYFDSDASIFEVFFASIALSPSLRLACMWVYVCARLRTMSSAKWLHFLPIWMMSFVDSSIIRYRFSIISFPSHIRANIKF